MWSADKMTNKITYFGSEKDISEAIAVLKQHEDDLETMKEADARLLIQTLIDEHHLHASILVNGNSVWSKERILRNLEQIMKHGTLYNQEDQSKPPILSKYFYQFLSLVCGSIAHYDLYGWVHKYPTIEHLKKFFKHNEFGKRVLDWIPIWHTDARVIVQQIETQLFPFESYMKSREEPTKVKRK
jgi:hypothetical protein